MLALLLASLVSLAALLVYLARRRHMARQPPDTRSATPGVHEGSSATASQRTYPESGSMHVLDALSAMNQSGSVGELHEFRLLCSGLLYDGTVQTAEWYKSDICRFILQGPITVFNCSSPMDAFPQELMLQVGIRRVEETTQGDGKLPKHMTSFVPDAEVAEDLAAILTLLLRRLITVRSHVRAVPNQDVLTRYSPLRDWPLPTNEGRAVAWRRRGSAYAVGEGGKVVDMTHYDAPALAVDVRWLTTTLATLAQLPEATAIVMAARLYSQAMQLIEDRPDVAYHLLVAAGETLTGVAVKDPPAREHMIKAKERVWREAVARGLPDDAAKDLAVLACDGMSWATQKFVRFLTEFGTDARWSKDDLFVDVGWNPKKETFTQALTEVYRARSGALHRGKPYPPTVGLGTSSQIPHRALSQIGFGEFKGVPPATWFEKVLQNSAIDFINKRCAAATTRLQEGSRHV